MAILIGVVVVLVIGILPMLAYAVILGWFDRYEKDTQVRIVRLRMQVMELGKTL